MKKDLWMTNLGEALRFGGHVFDNICPPLRARVTIDNMPPTIVMRGGV